MKNRRKFMKAVGILFIILLSTTIIAEAAQVEWKMATKMPPSSPEGMAFQKFADLVEEKSKGEMTIAVFPTEQLGKTEAVMEQLQAGIIQVWPILERK